MTVRCDGQTLGGSAGSLIRRPRGLPHTFRVDGDAPAHLLEMITPGAHAQFYLEDGHSVVIPP